MVRYTLLRLMIFFGCLAALWLVGLREPTELPWLVVTAAIASMLISMVVLKPFRAEMVQQIQDRQEAKARARAELYARAAGLWADDLADAHLVGGDRRGARHVERLRPEVLVEGGGDDAPRSTASARYSPLWRRWSSP